MRLTMFPSCSNLPWPSFPVGKGVGKGVTVPGVGGLGFRTVSSCLAFSACVVHIAPVRPEAAESDEARFGVIMAISGGISTAGVEGPDGTSGMDGCIGSTAGIKNRPLPPLPPTEAVRRIPPCMRTDGPN
jgi:hypothetical protein